MNIRLARRRFEPTSPSAHTAFVWSLSGIDDEAVDSSRPLVVGIYTSSCRRESQPNSQQATSVVAERPASTFNTIQAPATRVGRTSDRCRPRTRLAAPLRLVLPERRRASGAGRELEGCALPDGLGERRLQLRSVVLRRWAARRPHCAQAREPESHGRVGIGVSSMRRRPVAAESAGKRGDRAVEALSETRGAVVCLGALPSP